MLQTGIFGFQLICNYTIKRLKKNLLGLYLIQYSQNFVHCKTLIQTFAFSQHPLINTSCFVSPHRFGNCVNWHELCYF